MAYCTHLAQQVQWQWDYTSDFGLGENFMTRLCTHSL